MAADPLTFAVSYLSLLEGIAALSKQLTTFVTAVRGARKDVQGFSDELASLELAVVRLQDNEIHIPEIVKSNVAQILRQCHIITNDMQSLIRKHTGSGVVRKLQWTLSDGEEVSGLRQRLESHKAGLQIALSAAIIHQNNALEEGIHVAASENRAEFAALKREMALLQKALLSTPNPMLQRCIDHAESLVDPFETDDLSSTDHTAVAATWDDKIPPHVISEEEEHQTPFQERRAADQNEKDPRPKVLANDQDEDSTEFTETSRESENEALRSTLPNPTNQEARVSQRSWPESVLIVGDPAREYHFPLLMTEALLRSLRHENDLVKQRIKQIDLIMPRGSGAERHLDPISPYVITQLKLQGVTLREQWTTRELAEADFLTYNVILHLSIPWQNGPKGPNALTILTRASKKSQHPASVARLIFFNSSSFFWPVRGPETIYSSRSTAWYMTNERWQRKQRELIEYIREDLLNTCRALLVREFGLLYRSGRFGIRKGAVLPHGPFTPYFFDDRSPSSAEHSGRFHDSVEA